MNIEWIRASSLNSYQDCPWKYFLNNVIGIESQAGKKACLGTIVHHVLELMAKSKKVGHYVQESKFNDPGYLLEVCFKRYKKQHPDFDWDDRADKSFCSKQIDQVLNSAFHPFKLNILRTEQQFEIDMNEKSFKSSAGENIKFRGTIDLITQNDPDTLEIVDYKTGKRTDWITGKVKDYESFMKDLQLRMYDLAASRLYSYKNRILTIIFTQDGGPFTISFNDKQLKETIDILKQVVSKIKNDKKLDRLKDDQLRKSEFWKCLYVCQFGKISQTYLSEDGVEIQKFFKPTDKFFPNQIEQNGIIYHRVTDNKSTLCDQYRKIFDRNSLDETQKILTQLTIKSESPASRRNDYTNNKITKAKLFKE